MLQFYGHRPMAKNSIFFRFLPENGIVKPTQLAPFLQHFVAYAQAPLHLHIKRREKVEGGGGAGGGGNPSAIPHEFKQ